MIEFKNLKLAYGNHIVIEDLNAVWKEPGIYGIVGLNGAGKTTLFQAMSGMKKPAAGQIFVDEKPLIKRQIFFLETYPYFYPNITGREYLSLFECTRENYNESQLLAFLQLPLDDLIENYSTGMKKKLALMAMLKKEKAVYLLDEPFNGLDLESNHILEVILEVLKEKGSTVFIASHILDPMLRLCDGIDILESGNFKKYFQRDQFDLVAPMLFGDLAQKAKAVIENAL